jgi:hypothetical protein
MRALSCGQKLRRDRRFSIDLPDETNTLAGMLQRLFM